MAKLVVRVDDIHPWMGWKRFQEFIEEMRRHNLTGLLGVIPQCEDESLKIDPPRQDFWEVMKQLAGEGWILSQHGFRHVYDNRAPNLVGSTNRSEFAGHPLDVQRERVRKGVERLKSHGIKTDVFMAPGHTFDANTLTALAENGIRFVTDGYGLWPQRRDSVTLVPQLLSRPHGIGVGVYTTCFHLDTLPDGRIPALVENCARYDVVSFYEAAKARGPALVSGASRAASSALLKWMRKRNKEHWGFRPRS